MSTAGVGHQGLGINYPSPGVTSPKTAPNAFLSFQGIGQSSGYRQSFQVLAGQSPPTITGGYATWSNLSRPLQRALTIFTGYEPMSMTCDVIFGRWLNGRGWEQDAAAARLVEADIAKLDWMAGGGFESGPSPYVYVISYSTAGGQSDLVPAKYHGVPWIVTGLTWGQAWRNTAASRIYQEATVVLQQYLNLNTPPQPDTSTSGSWFVSSPGNDTALKIAASRASNAPTADYQSLARTILRAAENNPCKGTSIRLERRSISWVIRHGVKVFVPSHTIN
jgi:hypothetical protein